MTTYFLTRSLSEFRVNDDGSIDRMSAYDTQFRTFLPAGTRLDVLAVGNQASGVDPHGGRFSTNLVSIIYTEPPRPDPRAEAFAEIRALAEAL